MRVRVSVWKVREHSEGMSEGTCEGLGGERM